MGVQKYVLRFFFEWRLDTALWPGDEMAYEKLGLGPYDELTLPQLSPKTWQRMRELAEWHDTALNWDYPPDPGPWRQEECDRFNRAVRDLLEQIRQELGEEFEVMNQQPKMREDPDLNTYLKDPKGFKRQ
ncbi:MAG TPA: hypothetical protein V6D29_23130 [Leptolyngbyaceae cyanobacterium]